MPRHVPYLLRWSPNTQTYELSASGNPVPLELTPTNWQSWLDQITSFAFRSQSGAYCTVRKETIRGKGAYWYGYRSLHRRTVKRYVGRTTELSLARLEEVAASLQATSHPEIEPPHKPERFTPPAEIPLLATKLHPPRLPQPLIERTHLYTRLDAWPSHKLTLLSAPAGSGKTTLVNGWLRQSQFDSVAWVSLDASDNDPIRFWHALLTACQRAGTLYEGTASHNPYIMGTNQAYLQPHSLESVLIHFLNHLPTEPCLLILEDYHVISEPRIHETLGFLLAHLPESFHLLVMTRYEPPYVLGRLRASGEINELQGRDLRFSYDEMSAFLQQVLAVPLSPDTLERLETHLDGWAAGIKLLTLSLQGDRSEAQIAHLLTALSGSHRPIRDYFVTEVLHVQPQTLQDFLLRTSLLTRLSPSLCIAITGRQDSAQLLETIERSNLFLEALDGNSEWYRYHPLFAEAMQHEAHQRLDEQEIAQILRTASRWFEQHDLLSEAIEIALQLKERNQAACLIEQYVEALGFIDSPEHHTLRRWLEQIPEPLLRTHPILCLCSAVVAAFTREQEPGQVTLERIEHFLHMAEESWQDRPAERGRVLAFRAFYGFQRGMREHALAQARQALEWLPDNGNMWRAMSLIVLGLDALQAGHIHRARPFFQKISQSRPAADIPHFLDGMTIILGIICLAQGELHQAARYFRELSDRQNREERDPASAVSSLALAAISYEWNALDQAEQQFQEGQRQAKLLADVGQEPLSPLVEFVQALLLHAHGKTSQAIQRMTSLLIKAREQLQASENDLFPFLYQEVLSWAVRYALLLGDHTTAQHWIEDLTRLHVQQVPLIGAPSAAKESGESQLQQRFLVSPTLLEGKNLLMARLHLAQGNAEIALLLLQELLPEADAAGRGYVSLQIRLLLAQAYALRKQPVESRQILLQALEQGYAGGYQRSFLDEGHSLFLLLHDLFSHIQSPPLREYVQTLFHAFREARREIHITTVVPDLFEPLSKQEQRVLRLLVAGRSNQEIAEELVVSINTIRTQIQSIYRKLQVNNRQAASEAARHLNLL